MTSLGHHQVLQILREHDFIEQEKSDHCKFEIAGYLSDNQTGEIEIELEFNEAFFDLETITCIASVFHRLVKSLAQCQTPETTLVSDLRMISSHQEEQVLRVWSGEKSEISDGDIQPLHRPFEEVAQSTPNLIALEMTSLHQSITYGELNRWASQTG